MHNIYAINIYIVYTTNNIYSIYNLFPTIPYGGILEEKTYGSDLLLCSSLLALRKQLCPFRFKEWDSCARYAHSLAQRLPAKPEAKVIQVVVKLIVKSSQTIHGIVKTVK